MKTLHANTIFDVEKQHSQEDIIEVNEAELRKALEDLPCCKTSQKGKDNGDPYFTDGFLYVLVFQRRLISMMEVQLFEWEKDLAQDIEALFFKSYL